MALLLQQIFTHIACIISLSLFALRLKQIYRDQMNRTMKILHLSYMPLYALFDLIQILNLFGILTNHCRVWYILSMICLWGARFIFSLEMFYRAYMIVLALVFNTNPKKYLFPIIIIFILCLLSVLIWNSATISSLENRTICIPSYDETLIPIIIIHIMITILSVGSVAFLLKQLNYYATSTRIYGIADDFELKAYQLSKVIRKFSMLLISLTMSSICILFVSIFAKTTFGIFFGCDALLIMFLDILLYKQFDAIFSVLCGCFLPRRPPDKVKNLQQIASLFEHKYENEFESVILETLKQNAHVFISEDVIQIIMQFVKPITDLEHHSIYKPYWIPSVNVQNVDIDSIPYFTQNKYGGIPFLKPHESWPCCVECNHHLFLFLQLNMNKLPKEYMHHCLPTSIAGLYQNHLFQYFHCITRECFRDSCSTLLRFVEISENDDAHRTYCVEAYEALKTQQNIRLQAHDNIWMEHLISHWSKQEIHQRIFNNVNNRDDEEDDDEYDFAKYEYETPSLTEYHVFYGGVFDGVNIISNEIEKQNWEINRIHHFIKKPKKKNKLNGYYYCLTHNMDIDHDERKIPRCEICNNHMNLMLYQLDGQQAGFKYPDHHIGAIFICTHHPFRPQLVLLPASADNVLPGL